jgi:restriction system protein
MIDKNDLPMHVKFFLPIISALKKLGGSGTITEVKDTLIEILNIPEEKLEEKYKSGVSKIDNQINWSKVYLTSGGLIDISDQNIWSLTEKSLKSELSDEDVLLIFKQIHSGFVAQRGKSKKTKSPVDIEPPLEIQPHKEELLSILQALPPDGFERLCQRLLRASGFSKVLVTGKSGDGGIDGEGILEINPLISLKVIFQAKRYKGAVSASQIRDFRGAMQGRAEKGIFITTGRFTQEAKNEALREGAPPIELVDANKLTVLFEQRKLGLKSKIVYEIDDGFFEDYR